MRAKLLLIAVVFATLPFVARAAQDEQVFKAGAELVVLHVNVFNGRSDAVPDLPQSAFTVFEDDKPQEISFFSAGDVPVTVGLVIDNSTSMITERASGHSTCGSVRRAALLASQSMSPC